MLYQTSLLDIPSVISSPESASGPTHSDAPDGPTTAPCGPDRVLASLSARQAKEAGLLTSGTYGPRSTISSHSVDLMLSLASRLQALTALTGSTLFTLTWKQRDTPSGRSIFALRASGLPTSDSDCTSWPTPVSQPANGTPERFLERKRESVARTGRSMGIVLSDLAMVAQLAGWPTPNCPNGGRSIAHAEDFNGKTAYHKGKKVQVDLQATARLAGWPTPCQQDGPNQGVDRLPGAASLAGWAMPRANDAEKRGQVAGDPRNGLVTQANMATWATPTSRDSKDGNCLASIEAGTVEVNALLGRQALLTAPGETPSGSTAETANTGQLNPAHSRWLMGLPREWDDCAVTAMRSARRSRKHS